MHTEFFYLKTSEYFGNNEVLPLYKKRECNSRFELSQMGKTNVRTPALVVVSCAVPRAHVGPRHLEHLKHREKRGRGGGCPAGTGGGRDTYARQQKNEEGDAIPDLLLKHQNATLATYVEGR
jgi:hypothetical protein